MIAPLGVSIRADHRARHARDAHVPVGRQRLELFQQLHVGQRGQRLGGRVQGLPIHLLHQVAEPPARAAVDQRVAHLILRARARAPDTSATRGSPTCSSGARAAQ